MDKRKIACAKHTIEQIAKKNHTTVKEVKFQMKIAMINGLASNAPKIKTYWRSIPCEGEVPTPEEFIAYTADIVRKKKSY